MVLVVASEVRIIYRATYVLPNAAVLSALPHPETALLGTYSVHHLFFNTEGSIQIIIFYLNMS